MFNNIRKIKYKFYYYRRAFLDFIWNRRKSLVPFTTGVASLIWYFKDSGPEPIVLVVASFLTAFFIYIEEKDSWYSKVHGDVYEILWRADLDSKEKRIADAHQFIGNLDFVFKFQCIPTLGDCLNRLIVDTAGYSNERFITEAKDNFYVYYISKNGKQIYEREYP